MKKLLFVLCVILVGAVQAQNDQEYVKDLSEGFMTKLKERGITDYLKVEMYCQGTIEMFTLSDGSRCTSRGTYVEAFVFWNETDGSSWVKKIDNCGMFLSVQLNEDSVDGYAKDKDHWIALNKQEVKRFETVAMKKGQPVSRTGIHNCIRAFDFYLNGLNFQREFNTLSLQETSGNGAGDQNINYEHNSKLVLTALSTTCDALVASLQETGQFKRM